MRAIDAEDATAPRVFGVTVSPLGVRRWQNFTANRRGFWSLWIFLALFTVTLFAELVANDKPLLVRYNGALHAPVLFAYTETDFGGEFDLEADYRDPYIQDLILGRPAGVVSSHHYGFDYRAEFRQFVDFDVAVFVDPLGCGGARRVFARAQLRIHSRRARVGSVGCAHYVPSPPAECDGRHLDLYAVHS